MDPFYLIKQEITTNIEHIQELADTRNDMIHDPRGINIDVFKNLGIQAANEITTVHGLLKDIEETIKHVKANPENFPSVDKIELQNRTQFCEETGNELKKFEGTIKEQSTHVNQSASYIKQISSAASNDFEFINSTPNDGNNRGELASSILEQHDEQIDQIKEMAETQFELAKQISNELDEQNQIIIELDEGIDSAHDAMKSVTDQIKKIIENEGKLPTGIAFTLAIVLIILLFIAV